MRKVHTTRRDDMSAPSDEKALLEKYLSLSKKSSMLYERARRVIPDGSTRRGIFFPPYPAYIVRGEGCRVWDADGREYIDYTNNLGPLILGHKHPRVISAVKEQLECGTLLGGPTELEVQFAEKILEAYPSGEEVLFCASGTEANMIGLRAVRAYTGKEKILKWAGAFHGTSDGFSEGVGIPKDILAKSYVTPFNDIDQFEAAVKKYKDELAAVFVEPIMRGLPPKVGFLNQVREITKKYGVLLVFDEVVTGFRLARGGAQEKWGVKPDMTLLGKIIGGGFAVGAVVTFRELMKPYKPKPSTGLVVERPPISHAGTWNAHPIALAAGLATFRELTRDAYAHLSKMGNSLMGGMREILGKKGIVAQICGVDSVFHIYFTNQPVIDTASSKTANGLLLRCYDMGMMLRGIYPAKAHCSFVSTPITTDEVSRTLKAFEETLDDLKPFIKKTAPSLIV
jgi:glutamate-1-semialdehyde 2,1-aminomutase